MITTQGFCKHSQTIKSKSDFNYWHNRMSEDGQFVQYMTELYKKQQLDAQEGESIHHIHSPPSASIQYRQQVTRNVPQLMNQPASPSPIQLQLHHEHIRTSKTSTVPPKAQLTSQSSSTPRRPLEESSSSEKQSYRQTKKPRPQEETPTELPPTLAPESPRNQFHFPTPHLKRAISNNLPCFYITFEENSDRDNIPPMMAIGKWIQTTVQQQLSQSIEAFSLFVPVNAKRFKFAVSSKHEFLKIWKVKWPEKMDQLKVVVEKPRALPDCCALVVRYVPNELSNEEISREIMKTASSAVSFTKINYHYARATNDFRFCVTDMGEYEELANIGRIAIGHVLLPITTFRPSLKMTYCTKCWELGHTRPQCKAEPRCRKCLDVWVNDHKCQKPILCAQCKGQHFSLSTECVVVQKYRKTLKDQVDIAVKEGILRQAEMSQKMETVFKRPNDFPPMKVPSGSRPVWGRQPGSTNLTQQQTNNEQISELKTQINDVLDIARRLETKIDNQTMKLEMLEKKASINKQGIMVLVSIVQQMINSISEKKNKQQLLSLYQQLEVFKSDIMEKFNRVAIDHQSSPNSPTSIRASDKKVTQSTASIDKSNNNQLEKELSMEITNGQ